MRIAATLGAFFIGMFCVGGLRIATEGEALGFVGGLFIGLVQVFLFFGLPWLVWRALAPKAVKDVRAQ